MLKTNENKKEKRWHISNKHNPQLRDQLCQELNISNVLANLLIGRQIKDVSEGIKFLYPKLDHLHQPFLLKDMKNALERVKKAIVKKEKILIFGDWDVDGICSCVLLMRVLSQLNSNLNYYIPSREEYGLQSELIKQFHKESVNLIITVDCGTSNIEEIVYANSLGIDTIIIDHHEPKEELPKAYAIINPKQKDCKYPFKELAGVGVVFKFIQCLLSSFSKSSNNLKLINYIYENYLDLVAIGTIADIVPLVDENRIIAKFGLSYLRNTKKVGLKVLLSQLNLTYEKLSSKNISWKLVPVLNSAGRMNKTSLGADLLCIKNSKKALDIADELLKLNQSRKVLLQEGTSLISQLFFDQVDLYSEKVIVITTSEIHSGLIGILANRLLDAYFRPVVVFSVDGDMAKGSSRSSGNFDLVKALKYCEDLLINHGGHKNAAGLSLTKENIAKFKTRINEYAQTQIKDEDMLPELTINCEVNIRELNMSLVKELELLEPYGAGNQQPIFLLQNTDIVECRTVGSKANHLKLKVGDNYQEIDAIGFNMANFTEYNLSKSSLAFHFNINYFNGAALPQLQLLDIKPKNVASVQPSGVSS
ncbi:MAG: single-stranded-DNA-specific exonuclease RecJ [bacterium]|nr:single-stranded-DNA-specific exonuclease RecJ [bacterium]